MEENSGGFYIPIRMNEFWGYLGLRQHIVEHISSLQHKVSMRRSILVLEKYGTAALMLSLKDVEVKA